jgi:plasmid stabilization system protein ParE
LRYRRRLVGTLPPMLLLKKLGTPYRKRKNVRRLRCDPYFIYYRLNSEERVVEIMEFWHAARREPAF